MSRKRFFFFFKKETPSGPRSERGRKTKNLEIDFISYDTLIFLVEGTREVVTNKISILPC